MLRAHKWTLLICLHRLVCGSTSLTRQSTSGVDGCAPVWELLGDTPNTCSDNMNSLTLLDSADICIVFIICIAFILCTSLCISKLLIFLSLAFTECNKQETDRSSATNRHIVNEELCNQRCTHTCSYPVYFYTSSVAHTRRYHVLHTRWCLHDIRS